MGTTNFKNKIEEASKIQKKLDSLEKFAELYGDFLTADEQSVSLTLNVQKNWIRHKRTIDSKLLIEEFIDTEKINDMIRLHNILLSNIFK